MKKLLFSIRQAWVSVRTNKLRSGLTIAIIALGITVLIGILTATEVMKQGVYSNFSSLGANSFQITSKVLKTKKRGAGVSITFSQNNNLISLDQARQFKERFNYPSTVGITTMATSTATARYRSEKTNPNIPVMGVQSEYLTISGSELSIGRNFTNAELQSGSPVCIIGSDVANKLFRNHFKEAINRVITVGSQKFRVIAIAKSKGGSMMMNQDNLILIPLQAARYAFGAESFVINVLVNSVNEKDIAVEEAEGLFRIIRNIPLGYENNFSIEKDDQLMDTVLQSISYVSWAALVIAAITLLGSVIGLMNIMLVSVVERTREIGVSKALGAKSSLIRQQFLTESVFISLIGGLLGVVLGILLGNILGLTFGTGFVIPWVWIIVGFTLCTVVGILSGLLPAIKASKLDPINALRYE